jgi:hypothetical protein
MAKFLTQFFKFQNVCVIRSDKYDTSILKSDSELSDFGVLR